MLLQDKILDKKISHKDEANRIFSIETKIQI